MFANVLGIGSRTLLLSGALLALGSFAATDANAVLIDSTTAPSSFSVDFVGNIATTDVQGLTGTADFTFLGLANFGAGTNNAYKFDITLTNTSDTGIWDEARIAALGWNINPNAVGGSISGGDDFTVIVFNSAFPNQFGAIDVCVKGGQANNCQGGTGVGYNIGDADTFTVLLAFNSPVPTSITLDNLGVRYQSLTSNPDGIYGSTYNGASGTGGGTTTVSEPGILGLLGAGLVGLGFLIRRRVTLPVLARESHCMAEAVS